MSRGTSPWSSFPASTRYDLLTRLEAMPRHYKVCHGDFNPSNIMVTPEGVPFILDWSHATQGNASHDAARTYLLFMLKGEEARAEKYLDLFCQKSKTQKRYVQGWMPIVPASQSVKSHPEERVFLERWVNVSDFESIKIEWFREEPLFYFCLSFSDGQTKMKNKDNPGVNRPNTDADLSFAF